AFARAFRRDPRRTAAYDNRFHALRASGDDDELLLLLSERIAVSSETEVAPLWLAKANALRRKGDVHGALAAAEGGARSARASQDARALAAEMRLETGKQDRAAPALAELARQATAPSAIRRSAGLLAAELFEEEPDQLHRALAVLLDLE